MKKFLLLATLFLPVLSPAQRAKPDEDPCRKIQSQAELNQCTEKKFRTANSQLLKVYQGYLQLLQKNLESAQTPAAKAQSTKTLDDLKAAQLAWINYREAHCQAEADLYAGGSIQPSMYSACMETITRYRITQLDDTYGDK
ncbi:protein of unknown function DUF1311 [Candidatus Koribacter versatilis Ellin345]|uniref:Lysozyme inhibitor LprI-like N-terminal domain-containing protein n=1 Tax=Koribacter versatilis (strain Ellin345) TaxID=204669 RepID=Q1IP17_KORVE|nr:lysozyme inhibitor LprI family protein [Candidatus Koribacter versatilis]ABF41383.1 protein of unknown function DUF1311 [Candidatus Koribacter versatilis Ellin345]